MAAACVLAFAPMVAALAPMQAFRQQLSTAAVTSFPRFNGHAPARTTDELPGLQHEAQKVHAQGVFDQLLHAGGIAVEPDGRVLLQCAHVEAALSTLHLQPAQPPLPGIEHPCDFLPDSLLQLDRPVDVTKLVKTSLPRVLEQHPVFCVMAEALLEDDFYRSLYWGTEPRDESAIGFEQLALRLVVVVFVFEELLALDRDSHRKLARWYEALHAQSGEGGDRSSDRGSEGGSAPSRAPADGRSLRERLLAFFLTIKGESVLASINCFETMRRISSEPDSPSKRRDVDVRMPPPSLCASTCAAAMREVSSNNSDLLISQALSDLLNSIMALNLIEAIVSNLTFARWPDNARAGMALLLTQSGAFKDDLEQELSPDWFDLYLVWNACFVWPAHAPDMLCFAMLLMPSIASGPPARFQYNRAHTLFWVVRATQLTVREEMAAVTARGDADEATNSRPSWIRADGATPANRQPLTTRMAVLTGAQGERLAAASGEDVTGAHVWRRLILEVLPQQLANLVRLYRIMPKASAGKLLQL